MAGNVERLARAEPEFDRASGDEAIAVGIDDGEFAGRECECDGFGGVGVEMDAVETGKGAKGSAIKAGMGDVELGNLVAGDVASVGDFGGDGDRGGSWELQGWVRRVSRLRSLCSREIVPSPYGLG